MSNTSNSVGTPRALDARAAGVYLAERIGLPAPLSAGRVWHLARTGQLPHLRLGRRRWFQTDALDRFAATGGTRVEAE